MSPEMLGFRRSSNKSLMNSFTRSCPSALISRMCALMFEWLGGSHAPAVSTRMNSRKGMSRSCEHTWDAWLSSGSFCLSEERATEQHVRASRRAGNVIGRDDLISQRVHARSHCFFRASVSFGAARVVCVAMAPILAATPPSTGAPAPSKPFSSCHNRGCLDFRWVHSD